MPGRVGMEGTWSLWRSRLQPRLPCTVVQIRTPRDQATEKAIVHTLMQQGGKNRQTSPKAFRPLAASSLPHSNPPNTHIP